MKPGGVFDPGLQPERTQLAWRRTALGICVGSLIAIRVLPLLSSHSGLYHLWLTPGLVGLAFGVWLWRRAHVRYIQLSEALLHTRMEAAPGAGTLAILAIFVLMCGVLGLTAVLLAAT